MGNALNKNKDLGKIPCHRVIKSGGFIGGYVLGKKKKVDKLREEGIKISRDRIINFNDIFYKL